MEWAAVMAGLVTIAGLLLKQWLTNSPARKKEAADEAIQDSRQALIDGDVAAIEHRIDSLLQAGGGNSSARIESATDAERRISEL